jgi:hypothetical protein
MVMTYGAGGWRAAATSSARVAGLACATCTSGRADLGLVLPPGIGDHPAIAHRQIRTLGPPAQDARLVTVGDTHQTLVAEFSNDRAGVSI